MGKFQPGNKFGARSMGGGRSKAGDVQFLVDLMYGVIKKKDLPKNSIKMLLYEKLFIEKDMKALNKVLDKLYANQQNVDVSGVTPILNVYGKSDSGTELPPT